MKRNQRSAISILAQRAHTLQVGLEHLELVSGVAADLSREKESRKCSTALPQVLNELSVATGLAARGGPS
jgi:hypothetical protein